MKKSLLRLLPALFLSLTLQTTFAADKEAPSMSMTTFKRLQNIEDLVGQEKRIEAKTKLDEFLQEPPSKKIDQAYLYYTAGMFFLQEDKYQKADEYMLKAYQLDILPDKNTLYLLQILAGLRMQDELFKEAIPYYKGYIQLATEPKKSVYLGLATAHYYSADYPSAIKVLKETNQLFPKVKNVFLMMFSSYFEMKQLDNATDVMEQMVRHWPEEQKYWSQLAGLYVEQKKNKQALEILQLAKTKGFLTKETDNQQFVYLLYDGGMPFKAATHLQMAMDKQLVKLNEKNYQLLANLYQEARERTLAIEALKKVAEFAEGGKHYLYIAQLYYEQENQFKNVIEYAKKAIDKGVKQEGNANMLIAVAYSELDDTENAKRYLRQAAKFEKTKKTAEQWLRTFK